MELELNTLDQINRIKERCQDIKPLVVIRCITYNHEPYIKDALEGFVMQKTDFPVVAIVHDDASTDNTAAIIREYAEKYPDIIFPIYETENQYSKRDGSLGKIMKAAQDATEAKYVALCEGDDYWTDPLKLQKQVDFLESHPDYGMCYTKVLRYSQNKQKVIDIWGGECELFEELLVKNTIPTLTVLLKSDIFIQYYREIQPHNKEWKMGDYPLWLYVATKYKIKFFDSISGTYRILVNSASHIKDISGNLDFLVNYRSIAFFFAEKYQYPFKNNIKKDLSFWVYTYNSYNENNVSKYHKFKLFQSESKFKRKVLILADIISNNLFKFLLSRYLCV